MMKEHDTPEVTCKRCGKCCYAVPASITEEDVNRWKEKGKMDIVRTMEQCKLVWAGDIIVSLKDGESRSSCPFLMDNGRYHACTIYEDRPRVCRDYLPGSSEICPQFRK